MIGFFLILTNCHFDSLHEIEQLSAVIGIRYPQRFKVSHVKFRQRCGGDDSSRLKGGNSIAEAYSVQPRCHETHLALWLGFERWIRCTMRTGAP